MFIWKQRLNTIDVLKLRLVTCTNNDAYNFSFFIIRN